MIDKPNFDDAKVMIGPWRFDLAKSLLIGPSGQRSMLRPQTGAVLRLLADNAGQIVSRDQILAEVWADISVTDDSVTQCVREIRAGFGDDGHRCLST